MNKYEHIVSSLFIAIIGMNTYFMIEFIEYYIVFVVISIIIPTIIYIHYLWRNNAELTAYVTFPMFQAYSTILIFRFMEYGLKEISIIVLLSLVLFLNGCVAPDWDHQAVQKKYVIVFWLKYFTRHRGHFHSWGGLILFTLVSLLFMYIVNLFIPLFFWWIPAIASGFGYWSHLFEDWIVGTKEGKNNPFKFW